MLTTILKSFDTFCCIPTKYTSFTKSVTGIGLTVMPIQKTVACEKLYGNKQIYERVLQRYVKQKNYERANRFLKFFLYSINKFAR